MDEGLRRKMSALWLFHGATIERSLELAEGQLAAVAFDSDRDPEDQDAALVEEEKVRAALVAFRAIGEELQK